MQIVDLPTLPTMPHDPDVILYDTVGRLPDVDEKLRMIVGANDARVIVHSWDDYPEEAARRQGAAGYLSKSLGADELVAAIVAIHDGRPVPDGARTGTGDAGEPVLTWPGQVDGLTQRESERCCRSSPGASRTTRSRAAPT